MGGTNFWDALYWQSALAKEPEPKPEPELQLSRPKRQTARE